MRNKKEEQSLAIEIAKGFGIVILFWVTFTFFAFIVFSRASEHTNYILISTTTIFFLISSYLIWKKYLGYKSWISALSIIVLLILMFLVPLGKNIPLEAQEFNENISQRHEDRYDYAEDLFFNLKDKWTSPVRQYLLEPHKNFIMKDFGYFWERQGEYADSNTQAQIYKRLLTDSSRFSDDEVFLRRTGCGNSPHGYIAIVNPNHPGGEIYADLWAADYFGEEYEFGMYTRVPCNYLLGEPFKGE